MTVKNTLISYKIHWKLLLSMSHVDKIKGVLWWKKSLTAQKHQIFDYEERKEPLSVVFCFPVFSLALDTIFPSNP